MYQQKGGAAEALATAAGKYPSQGCAQLSVPPARDLNSGYWGRATGCYIAATAKVDRQAAANGA
jgi:hypothetical protein